MSRRGLNLCKCRNYRSVSQEAAALLQENMRRALLCVSNRILTSATSEVTGAAEYLRQDGEGQGFRKGLSSDLSMLCRTSMGDPLKSAGERNASARAPGWKWQNSRPCQADAGILARHFGAVRGGASGVECRGMAGSSVLGGSSSRCYSAESTLEPPAPTELSRGSQSVFGRLTNTPRYMFKSDVLWVLREFKLRPKDVTFIYDPKCRLKFIQVQLPSEEDIRQAQRTLSGTGRFGGRYLKLAVNPGAIDEINEELSFFRGRSVLMSNLHYDTALDEVERFFAGYSLDGNRPIRFMRMVAPANYNTKVPGSPASRNVRTETETRALVRFRTSLEALRALREKQGSFCRENTIELRFIE